MGTRQRGQKTGGPSDHNKQRDSGEDKNAAKRSKVSGGGEPDSHQTHDPPAKGGQR